MRRFVDRVAKVSGQLSVAAAAVLCVGAFLPWCHVFLCIEECFKAGDWNVLQVGGRGKPPTVGVSGPSTYTIAGIVVLAGAALLVVSGVLAIRVLKAGVPSVWVALIMGMGGTAALVGSLVAPVPRRISGGPLSFEFGTTPGIGP